MAMLAGTGLFIIQHVLPRVKNGSVLSIARMSMGWDVDDIVKNLEERGLPYSAAAAERMRAQNSLYTSREFFELLGFESYTDIDFDPNEGCSIIHDLNEPLPDDQSCKYDLVIENGTLEHIFDIKTALGNVARAVAEGGMVCHVSPLDAFNHGFYNFSLNVFNDFYRVNGFDDFQFFGYRYSQRWQQDQTVVAEQIEYTHEEFYFDPGIYTSPYNKLGVAFIATKKKHVPETVVPVQAAYDRELNLPSRLTA